MAETREVIPLENLDREPYRSLVAYPDATDGSVESRIQQLSQLGITGLEFHGGLRIGKVSLLGKGVVGLVFAGQARKTRVAVKIRRVDSRRRSMLREAEMIKAANRADVGPEFLDSSPDVLIMEYVEGKTLPAWLLTLGGRGTRSRIRGTLKELFEQSVRLDAYGIDHGELSRAHKNVLVTPEDKPWIVDFEGASLMRRVNNFTSITQYILLSGRFSKKLLRLLGPVERDELVRYLRLYKSGRTNDAFEAVAKVLRF